VVPPPLTTTHTGPRSPVRRPPPAARRSPLAAERRGARRGHLLLQPAAERRGARRGPLSLHPAARRPLSHSTHPVATCAHDPRRRVGNSTQVNPASVRVAGGFPGRRVGAGRVAGGGARRGRRHHRSARDRRAPLTNQHRFREAGLIHAQHGDPAAANWCLISGGRRDPPQSPPRSRRSAAQRPTQSTPARVSRGRPRHRSAQDRRAPPTNQHRTGNRCPVHAQPGPPTTANCCLSGGGRRSPPQAPHHVLRATPTATATATTLCGGSVMRLCGCSGCAGAVGRRRPAPQPTQPTPTPSPFQPVAVPSSAGADTALCSPRRASPPPRSPAASRRTGRDDQQGRRSDRVHRLTTPAVDVANMVRRSSHRLTRQPASPCASPPARPAGWSPGWPPASVGRCQLPGVSPGLARQRCDLEPAGYLRRSVGLAARSSQHRWRLVLRLMRWMAPVVKQGFSRGQRLGPRALSRPGSARPCSTRSSRNPDTGAATS
jgi:hypothetical protein